jgi:putative endonuclease
MKSERSFANHAEEIVADYLEQQGLKLIEANYSFKGGEIDLIMKDGETLVFTEVRHRKKDKYGSGLESVSQSKQNKIIRTAKYYLLEKNIYDKVPCRFDVVATKPNPDIKLGMEILWLRDAFWVKY